MVFTWDENKAEINRQKHGISFEEAVFVFQDFHRIEEYDRKHSESEDRYITIGKVKGVIVVIYTERAGYIRLISARRANRREQEKYYGLI